MYSEADNLLMQIGFPHSEIPGSKLVCQLTEAYRRLPRPSSPVTAQASTVCAYSLDPDRKSVVLGKSVDLGGGRTIKKK